MYQKSFFLEKNIGNNAFSYNLRKNKFLYVPALIIWWIEDISLWNEVVFEDVDFDWNLQSCMGLKNFYKLPRDDKEIILFDNHNHAYFFWWESVLWNSKPPLNHPYTLIHIDEHSDMRDPWIYLATKPTLEEVFHYTNEVVNVWNYIIPAIHDGIIKKDVIQIRDTSALENYFDLDLEWEKIILNLDIDFFEPALDFIDYDLKKKVVLDAANKADIITVATSPFFINQQRAIDVFKDIFNTSS